MEKRTAIDWSKHVLITKEDSLCKIHWLRQLDTMTHNVMFIHIENILVVKGDFGRWSFSRDFDPENFNKTGISDNYWCEKIEMGSEQETEIFNNEIAELSIKEKIAELLQNAEKDEDGNVCFELENEQNEYEFWHKLLGHCDDDDDLTTYFRENRPDSLDFESYPLCRKQNNQLDAIFDAFEEIIKRVSN